MSKNDLACVLAAIRSQPWAIVPEYLEAIEAIALRAMDAEVLERVAKDGHVPMVEASRTAVAAMGQRLDGTQMSMIRGNVAVVPLIGTIFPRASLMGASTGGTALATFMSDMRVAWASESVDRIVMLVDSPGGVVSGLGEAAETLRASPKPITAFVTGTGASAAYWLASQAQEIVLDRSAMVGSIGVLATLSRQEGPDASGNRTYEITSSGAPEKRPDPATEEGRAAIQRMVDAAESVFIGDVAAGRGVNAATVRSEFGRGGMLTGAGAVAAGMADRIGTLEAELAGKTTQSSGRTRGSGAGRRARAAAQIETRRRAAEERN
ncbi:ClpP class serine protease [Sagittula marina]|uniref:ClpP class serine protease n=1 Tax=Sagittula marina TaxID=943940 RepID=A0A7W6DNT5_9RHOB|nr:S49 family peptidase [Sagittula marina]MBB3986167.1 ClpP class serine protease [Sagittula marina]